ncbi:MAG: hypothetical protein EZS28_008658 [Streblomastix strix]|uniref:Uncharacterized protein n=1 Tax=Streblomastix strix TaxID=222440 RepID=A0A5J4WLV6_9EUKA|nr:MAG: hypothetical protein EZS28_008658 [Streblomastix strix]
MILRLTKEQLNSLVRLIGFVGKHDLSNGTVLRARFELENAFKYYLVARPYTYSNELKQRIVAAIQQRQQDELQKTSQEQDQEQDLQQATTSEDQSAQNEVQVDLQTMTSKLTIEQLETLNRLIGFVDMNDQFVTESSLRFKLHRALQYYNIPGTYIYSNELKQKIVAAVQQRQQEILKLQDYVALHLRQATELSLTKFGVALLPAHLGEQVLPAQEKEKEKDKEPPKQKKDPIKIRYSLNCSNLSPQFIMQQLKRLEYDKDDDDLIYNEPLDLLTFELDKYEYDYSQPSTETRIREFLNQWFTEEPQEHQNISFLQHLSSEAIEKLRQRKLKPIRTPIKNATQPLDDQDEQGDKSMQFETIKRMLLNKIVVNNFKSILMKNIKRQENNIITSKNYNYKHLDSQIRK